MVLVAERTASIMQPTQRLRALRRTLLVERDDEIDGGPGEGVVAQADAVEAAQDGVTQSVGAETILTMTE